MKVILTQKVKNVGVAGEIVNVSAGYARNFLVPQNLGLIADEGNTKKIEDYRKRLAKKVEEEKVLAQEVQAKLNGLTLSFVKRVGGNGRLFGTLTTTEIAKELEKQGLEVEKKQIVVENPIKTLGDHSIKAKLFTDVYADFTVKVEMSAKQQEEMKKAEELAAARKKKEEEKAAELAAQAEAQDSEESVEA